MPNDDCPRVVNSHWIKDGIKGVLENAGRVVNGFWGCIPLPGFVPNDAKYGIDLGNLKYSETELLRIASSWRDFNDRSDRVIRYLVGCNPHLKATFDRMDDATRRVFYKRLREDQQFNWCLKKYPGIELADERMQPGLDALYASDSVARDKIRNVGSSVGGLIIHLLALWVSGKNNPDSQRNRMDRAPGPVDPNRLPISGADALGLGASYGASVAANRFLYGTYESFELFDEQQAKLQGERTSRLLKDTIEKVVSEHEEGVNLPRGSRRGGGIVHCVSVDPGESPSEADSEALRKIKYGQTGCTSVCGTQRKTAVETCLREFYTPAYSEEDNRMCEQAGPFKSKEALTSEYTDLARRGIYQHERDWRRDQRLEFGECKDPAEENFNAYPGGHADAINHLGGFSEKGLNFGEKLDSIFHKRFKSSGAGFRRNNCRYNDFPGPLLEEENPPYESTNFQCEDGPQDPSDDLGDLNSVSVYSPNIKPISNADLVEMLQDLRNAVSSLDCEDPGKKE